MPTCFITLSEICVRPSSDDLDAIRDIVAEELTSGARYLDRNHIVLRVGTGERKRMLGEIELEVFAQFFVRRFFDRDRRAERISRRVSILLHKDCATWINLSVVGYSRVTASGAAFFSD